MITFSFYLYHTSQSGILFNAWYGYLYTPPFISCLLAIQFLRSQGVWRMKVSRIRSFQRNVLMMFQRKKRVTTSVTLGNVQRKVPLVECCSLTCIVRKAFYKLKNQWKQSLGWQRSSTPQYSYDLHSYCLNFDDGSSNDHMIPSRVCWSFLLLYTFSFSQFWISWSIYSLLLL